MAIKTNVSEDQYINLCNNLNDEIENAYQALKSINKNLTVLMTGDKEGPYWNGLTAKSFYSSAKANIVNDIKAYKEACDAWTKLEERYINLLRKGYFK